MSGLVKLVGGIFGVIVIGVTVGYFSLGPAPLAPLPTPGQVDGQACERLETAARDRDYQARLLSIADDLLPSPAGVDLAAVEGWGRDAAAREQALAAVGFDWHRLAPEGASVEGAVIRFVGADGKLNGFEAVAARFAYGRNFIEVKKGYDVSFKDGGKHAGYSRIKPVNDLVTVYCL